MSSNNVETLRALLQMDEAGEELASLLNELLIDSTKRNVLLVKLNEMRKEMSTLGLEVRLTRSEEAIRSIVLGSRKPLTAQEVAAKVGDEFRSLKHTTHASTVLNSLASKGITGKFKLGHNYYFTSPKEAVSEQLKRRAESPQECSPAEIAEETGMPLAVVLDAIEGLLA
ncbi:hypothetical protein ACFLWS_01485 [Chloroflexota bacterium]